MAAGIGRSPLTMLIVEDDPEAVTAVARLIARRYPDLVIHTAGTGIEGVALCRQHGVDIVITDINMPVMDGLQMACAIRSFECDARFIVLSGYNDREHIERANGIGVSDYIVKPIHFQKLFAAIDTCLREIAQGTPKGDHHAR